MDWSNVLTALAVSIGTFLLGTSVNQRVDSQAIADIKAEQTATRAEQTAARVEVKAELAEVRKDVKDIYKILIAKKSDGKQGE